MDGLTLLPFSVWCAYSAACFALPVLRRLLWQRSASYEQVCVYKQEFGEEHVHRGFVDVYYSFFIVLQFVEIGIVTSIEVNHKPVEVAKKGQEVCVKIEPIPGESPKMYGRHFEATDILVSKVKAICIFGEGSWHSGSLCEGEMLHEAWKTYPRNLPSETKRRWEWFVWGIAQPSFSIALFGGL